MATTDVALVEYKDIPNLDPGRQVLATWKLLVRDDVTNEVWEALPSQFKGVILPAVIPGPLSAPAVSLTLSASTGAVGVFVTLAAIASSSASTIAKVDFFDSGVKIGASVTTQPYQASYAPASIGRHTIVAVATDATGTATTSASQYLDVSAPAVTPIIVSLNPLQPTGSVGTALSLTATASIAGDTIAKVEFFDGASLVGTAYASPYGCSYVLTTPVPHYFSAKATTGTGASAISPVLTVQGVQPLTLSNQPPSCSLSASANSFVLGGSITLSALAADVDGRVATVEFFDGAYSLGSQNSSPYSLTYTPSNNPSNIGGHAISAKATDNLGAFTVATINITVTAVPAVFSPPTNVVATVLPVSSQFPAAAISVSWLAPPPVAGSTIISYAIYRTAANTVNSGVAYGSSATLNFIDAYATIGVSYTYTVTALNASGQPSGQSTPSLPATIPAVVVAIITAPSAPTIGTAAAGNASASIAFTAPANNGGATITGYTATSTPGNYTGTGTSSPITVSGLTNGTTYTFTVVATNSAGNSLPSASASVTLPIPATAPGAPTTATATASAASLNPTITITATAALIPSGQPANTGYVVYRINGGASTLLPTSSLPYTDSGVVNGQSYSYTVASVNSAGTSATTATNSVALVAPVVVYSTTLTGPSASPTSGQPGAGITLASGGADLLKFNSITGGSSIPQHMNIYIAGVQVAGVDLPISYIGAGFTYTPAGGTLRSGIFANGNVTVQ